MVNGRVLPGHQPRRTLIPLIDQEITKANRALRQGRTTRKTYYEVLQRNVRRRVRRRKRPRRRRSARRLSMVIYKVPVTGRSPWAGARDPLVTLVMYVDVQCPYSKYGACVVRQLRKQFPNDLKVVYRANPLDFHCKALPAAEALMEAHAQKGNRGFWALYDRLFPLKYCRAPVPPIRSWLRSMPRYYPPVGPPWLRQAAQDVGLDLRRFDSALRKGVHRKRVLAEKAQAARLGARGTPAYFINGRYLRGIRPQAKLKRIIEQQRRKAKALMRRRQIPRRRLYQEIIKRGATKPVVQPSTAGRSQ